MSSTEIHVGGPSLKADQSHGGHGQKKLKLNLDVQGLRVVGPTPGLLEGSLV